MNNYKINHFAVWVMVIFYMVSNMAWYGIFSQPWMALSNISEMQIQGMGSPMFPYIIALLHAVAMFYTLAWLLIKLDAMMYGKAILFSFIVWFSLIFLDAATKDQFSMRTLALTMINEGITLVNMLVASLVIVVWKKKSKNV